MATSNLTPRQVKRQCSRHGSNTVLCECNPNPYCEQCDHQIASKHRAPKGHKPVLYRHEEIFEAEQNKLNERVDTLFEEVILFGEVFPKNFTLESKEDYEKYISLLSTRSQYLVDIIQHAAKEHIREKREELKKKIKHKWYLHKMSLYKDGNKINRNDIYVKTFDDIKHGSLAVQLDLPEEGKPEGPKLSFTVKEKEVIRVPMTEIDAHEKEFYVFIQQGGYPDKLSLITPGCFYLPQGCAQDQRTRQDNYREATISSPQCNHTIFSKAPLKSGEEFEIRLEVEHTPAMRKYEGGREIPFIFGVTTYDPSNLDPKCDFTKEHMHMDQ